MDARAVRVGAVVLIVVGLAGQLAVGMRASRTASITGDEPFYLLTTQSLASDGDLDLRDEYRLGEERRFWDGRIPLWRQMAPDDEGRLLAPHDPGLSLVILPAYELGGLRGVQRFLVVLWALAMAGACLLALRMGAPPWAAATATVAVGAGVPGIVYASQVYPEGPAALCVVIGLLAATGARPRPLLLAGALVALAWLGIKYVPAGAVIAGAWAWKFRDDRRALVTAGTVAAMAAVHYVWWHLHTFDGLTPYTANVVWSGAGDYTIISDHFDWSGRSYRLYGLFLDARFGLLRWLPLVLLAPFGVGAGLRWPDPRRSAQNGSADVVAAGAVAVAAVVMGTFASITMMGWWFPGRLLVAVLPAVAALVALGAARWPRTALALAVWSVLIGAAVAWSARTGGIRLAVDPFDLGLPLAPRWLFPDFRQFGLQEVGLSLGWLAALILLVWRSCFSWTGTPSPTAPSSPSPPIWPRPRAR